MRLTRFAVAYTGMLFALCGVTVPALAGPPYQTDDPAPVPYRHYEIYLGTQEENGAGGLEAEVPFLEVNYGPMPNVQVAVSTPYAFTSGPQVPLGRSVGALDAGVKVRFIQETVSHPQVAFYPSMELSTDGSAAPKLFLPLWAQQTMGRTTIFGGGGWERNPGAGNRNFWSGGVADTYQFSKPINAGIEVYGNTPEVWGERGSMSVGIGMNDDFSDIHSFVVSIGTSFAGQRDLHAYAAYEFRLGPGGTGDRETDSKKRA